MDGPSGQEKALQDRTRSKQGQFPLDLYRVLDLTDEKGYMCGQILGGLGADVIKVEPPCGDKGRRLGPFYGDLPHPEKSLYWFGCNINKRSITLNLEKEEGKEIFRRLVKTADFVIESFDPGTLNEMGIGYSALSRINPKIILTSITPFGQTGPHKNFKGSDIVCWAGSGYMWLTGDEDRAPLRFSVPQAYFHGGTEGALGSLVALWERHFSGEGQHVDVSIQESIMFECLSALSIWDLNRNIIKREGAFRRFGPFRMRYVWPCKDGYVLYMMLGGHIGARGQRALVEWMDREGMADDFLRSFDWGPFDSGAYSDSVARKMEPAFERFFMTKTKQELFDGARAMQYLLAPFNSVKDMLESPQFQARDFWVKMEHPELGVRLTYPGSPFKSTEFPWKMEHRAPLIGENNGEIYGGELGFTREQMAVWKSEGVI